MKRLLLISLTACSMLIFVKPALAQETCGCDITSTTVTSVPPSHTFGIVLVQFSDWSTNDDARGGKCLRHVQFDHYTWQQFRRAFFTQDSYITNPNGAQTHDLEAVFGSLRDYFNEASYNKYDVVKHPTKREILNDTTAAGIPIWITLTQTKAWWNAQPINPINLLNAAYQAAQAAGMPIDTVGYNKIAVIYAGKELAGGLNGAASGRVYQAGEKTPFKHGRTQTEGTFYGIGSHCHEYGHVIGMRDLYSRNDPDHRYGLGELSLMASGNQGFVNGNRSNSTKGGFHAPVHLDAWHKLQLGWAKHKVLSSGSYTFKSFEAEDTIAVHFINDANPTDWVEGEYFLFANVRPTFSSGARTFDGDLQNNGVIGGLVLTHYANGWSFSNSLNLEVIEADGSDSVGTRPGVARMDHLFPGALNKTSFTTASNPPSNDIFGTPTGLSLTNIANNNGVVSTTVAFQPMFSISSLATAANGSRKLVRDSYGVYHLVFESAGHIYYRKSTDGGNTWGETRRILALSQGNCRYPGIAERKRTDATNQPTELFVVWQRRHNSPSRNWIQYSRSTNGGNSWVPPLTMDSEINQAIDPLPVIATNLPGIGSALELMFVYRFDNGLRFSRWASNTWQQLRQPVSGTTSASRNPSLVYKPNDSGYFNLAWDDGSNIRHQTYYGGTTWGTATIVSSGTAAYNHQFPSYALASNTSSYDRHIVWQAFEAVDYQKQAIYHNKNLTNIFTVFASTEWDHLKPSGTGHANGTFTALCHDSNNNVRKRYYKGCCWQSDLEGTVIASNGLEVSASITNPPGGAAKAVWRSAGNAPYMLTVGPSGGLSKETTTETLAYHRRIIFSLNNSSTLALQMGTVQLLAADEKNEQTFSVISDQDSIKTDDLARALTWSNIHIPLNADSLVFEVKIYAQEAGELRYDLGKSLDVAFDLLSAEADQLLTSTKLATLNTTGTSRQSSRLAFSVQTLRNKQVHLTPVISNLNLAKVNGALIHVYEDLQDRAQKARQEEPLSVTAVQPASFSVQAYPNPFNPATQIHFFLPHEGTVAVRIYDINGRIVRDLGYENRMAGGHTVAWDGRDDLGRAVASGMYFPHVSLGEERKVAKIMLVR